MNSLIRKSIQSLQGYVPGEQPQDPGFVKLNTNENPYPPSPQVGQRLASLAVDQLRLYPDPVCRKLRDGLAALHQCSPDQIFVANGSDEVLRMCVQAFAERNGSVGFFEPSYSLYPVLSDIEGIVSRPVRLWPDFSWSMPADYEASLFFLANPNAPTGIQYPRETVSGFCSRFSGVVLVDEAYVDFADYNCVDLALSLKNVLVARTFSKSYSLAGLRVGYILGSKELIDVFYKTKDSYNVDRLAQEIALAAIQDAGYMRGNVSRIRQTRARVSAELERRRFLVHPSATNFLWVRPPDLSALELYEKLKARKILVRYFKDEVAKDYLRITMGTDEQMDVFLRGVDEILHS
ncbi:MAG: histidinol-phosphate transaminase [Lentisphaerota bacterium]